MARRIADRTRKYGAVVFCFVFTVCFYGLYNIYLNNAEDLWFSLSIFSSVVIPGSLIALAVLLLLSWFLPETKNHIIIKLFFGVMLATYIQGTFLNINYGTGVLDGTEIAWGDYTTYAILDTLAWIVCLAAPFIIDIVVKKSEKKFFRILTYTSLFIVAIQIPGLVSDFLSYHPTQNNQLIISRDNMFEVGKSDNIFIFILDTLDEEYYQTFIDSHPEYTEQLEGFVHYDNAAAAGGRTIIGLPAMLSGEPFTRNEVYSDYLHRIWSRSNPLSMLHDAGYHVNVYSETRLFSSDAVDYIDNFKLGSGSVSSYKAFGKKVIKMDLYRFAPHLLKRFFWYYTGDFEAVRNNSRNAYKINDVTFYKRFDSNKFTINPSWEKTIHVYHLHGAHIPYYLDEFGNKTDEGTRESQVAGGFYRIGEMLQDLKDKGLYDNSTIILTTDHGETHQCQFSMFLLKESGAKGEYRTSSVPVSHFDLPVYLASLAGGNLDIDYGMAYSEIQDGERERHYFYNTSGSSKVQIKEYMTTGHAGDFDNWKVVGEYEDTTSSSTEYTLGTQLLFTTDATGNIYTVEGFGNNTGYQTKCYGPVTTLRIPIKNPPLSGQLVASIRTLKGFAYPYTILANNTVVYDSKDHDESAVIINFNIPAVLLGSDHILTLDIRFPDIDMGEMEKSVKKRTLTGGLKALVIDAE